MTEEERLAATGGATPPVANGLGDLARQWLTTWRELAGVRVQILLEESREALRTAEWLVGGAVLAALLVSWTWLLLLGLLAAFLVREGLGWETAAAVLLGVNVIALLGLTWALRRGIASLGLPHTVAALAGRPAPPARADEV